MKKTFPLQIEGKHPDRVLDAVKHDVRQYLKRERRKALPADADFLDFDCRFGLDAASAAVAHVSALTGLIDQAAKDGAAQVYVEVLARPAKRTPRPKTDNADTEAEQN